jgi:hypothetical protein
MPPAGLRQPSLLLPFKHRWRPEFDAVTLAVGLPLWGPPGRLADEPLVFRVDTGAMLTVVPLRRAEQFGLPVPPPEAEIEVELGTASGPERVAVRPGRIRVWWTRDRTGHPFD